MMKGNLYHRALMIFAAAAIGSTTYFSHANNRITTSKAEPTVYICTGSHSAVYHRSSKCRGLGNCRASIKAVTKSAAEKAGRRACRICATY